MNNPNIQKHPCADKCSDFKTEQCNHCLINDPSSELTTPVSDPSSDFAVGDCVVYEKTDSLFYVEKIIEEMLLVKHSVTGCIYKQHQSMFRHATPAELKAKRRLDAPVALFVEGE